MARKVTDRAAQDQASASSGADDLDVLFPAEVEETIAGEALTFREYRFVQTMALNDRLKPIVNALADRCMDASDLTPDVIMDVVVEHHDVVPELVAASCGKDVAWFDALGDEDGMTAMEAWLAASLGFFVRRTASVMTHRVMEAVRRSAGPTSSTPSSPEATDSPTSASTPAGS